MTKTEHGNIIENRVEKHIDKLHYRYNLKKRKIVKPVYKDHPLEDQTGH